MALESKPDDGKEIPVVSVFSLKRETLSDSLSYPARVQAKVNAMVLSDSEGVIAKVLTPLGTQVKKGQQLLRIRHTDPVYQYAAVIVRAPVDGVVSSIAVREGTQVARNQELLSVTDPTKVRVQIEVAAADLKHINANLEGEFRWSGLDAPLRVKVVGVSPFVSPATGAATGELAFLDLSQSPNPGIVGQAIFKTNIREGILVPDHAIHHREGNTYLRVVAQDLSAKKVLVTLGRKQSGMVEVLKGVNEGETIIERSSRFVGDGQKVTVQEKKKEST